MADHSFVLPKYLECREICADCPLSSTDTTKQTCTHIGRQLVARFMQHSGNSTVPFDAPEIAHAMNIKISASDSNGRPSIQLHTDQPPYREGFTVARIGDYHSDGTVEIALRDDNIRLIAQSFFAQQGPDAVIELDQRSSLPGEWLGGLYRTVVGKHEYFTGSDAFESLISKIVENSKTNVSHLRRYMAHLFIEFNEPLTELSPENILLLPQSEVMRLNFGDTDELVMHLYHMHTNKVPLYCVSVAQDGKLQIRRLN